MVCGNLKTTHDTLAIFSKLQGLETARLQHTRPRREYDERDANPKPSRRRTDDAANREGRVILILETQDVYEARDAIPTQDISHRDASGETENQSAGGVDGRSAIP